MNKGTSERTSEYKTVLSENMKMLSGKNKMNIREYGIVSNNNIDISRFRSFDNM